MTNDRKRMAAHERDSGPREETEADRLRGIIAHDALSVGLVSALAGDRPLTETEKSLLAHLKDRRGERFFSDLLYAITHQYFPPSAAQKLWEEVLRHKYEMSKALNRNAQIIVATLDYLSNCRTDVRLPTLVSEARIAEIVNLSMRDGLTGLFNHSSFYEILDLELRKRSRYATAVSVVVTDIDDFKEVNDRCGHEEGDRILVELAAILKSETRESDICCRYGGEEFAVILPFTHAREAGETAERVRRRVTRIRSDGCSLTVSSGVASCDEKTTTSHALVEKADRALYEAKKSGKNRVVISGSGGRSTKLPNGSQAKKRVRRG